MAVPSILLASATNEWMTPARYVTLVKDVLKYINLDPASSETANRRIQAHTYYTEQQNGLHFRWRGKIFLNPPYGTTGGKSNQAVWSRYLIQQYDAGFTTEAILLVNAVTGNKWFAPLWRFPICLTDHRIRFENEQGEAKQPTFSNAFVYLGPNIERFDAVFHNVVGHVVFPRGDRL